MNHRVADSDSRMLVSFIPTAAQLRIFIVSIQEPFSSPWTTTLRELALPRRLLREQGLRLPRVADPLYKT